MAGLPQPEDLASLVLRTDFTDDAAWAAVMAAVDTEDSGATFVSDPAYDGVSIQSLVDADAAAGEDEQITYVFLADATTMRRCLAAIFSSRAARLTAGPMQVKSSRLMPPILPNRMPPIWSATPKRKRSTTLPLG